MWSIEFNQGNNIIQFVVMLSCRILRGLSLFSMRKVGNHYVPILPTYRVNDEALRPYSQDESQLDRDQYYKMLGFDQSYKELPQCRYFAVQYKNRVHHVFNAYYYPMGRMITKIATAIRGRNSPLYKNSQANIKNGDVCIIVNAVDPLFTGKKLLFKNFKYHTGFIGNLKTFSYKSVLNKKPELLYYYLIRKAIPKNKVSEKYMENVKIFRGPTHNIQNIPQFAPPKFQRDSMTEIDFQKYIESIPDSEKTILFEADQEESYLGKDLHASDEVQQPNLDTDPTLSSEEKFRRTKKYSEKEMIKFQKFKKRIMNRYKIVRAPYRKKGEVEAGFKIFHNEKEARNSPYYDEIINEDLEEVDEQVIEDPFKRKGFDKE